MSLPEKFSDNRRTVCVQGLGFVGAAMAVAVANARDDGGNVLYNVIGFDVPGEEGQKKADKINKGIFPYENKDDNLSEALRNACKEGNLWATTDADYYRYADIAVVDINLDIVKDAERPYVKMDGFRNAIHTLGRMLRPEALVIVETTVPPGTCERIVYPILKEEFEKRGLPEESIRLAHSYERVMPGKDYYNSIVNFWRVYSGINEASEEKCRGFLESIINTAQYPLKKLGSTAASETAKVLENSYRAMNIAFMEEWGSFAESIGIDMFEIVNAIRVRPTHSNIRQPGFGVGGYCLTKDPLFAMISARDIYGIRDASFPFCEEAVKINDGMPLLSVERITGYMNGDLSGKKILLLGVSYRQDVGDTRYSPSEIFVREAERKGAVITCQDPLVEYWHELDREVLKEIPDLNGFDVIFFAVDHKEYHDMDFSGLKEEKRLIYDANNVLTGEQRDILKKRPDIDLMSVGRG
ncbi:MAG TPA: nucleotide sugar dehydrogenase [Lachnospiraceae bacterium]|nr:nucleotide sugar dehydrogenase [Lachnospiraceae bacterium]